MVEALGKALFFAALILPPMYMYHYMYDVGFDRCERICHKRVESYSVFQCKCK